MAIEEISYGTLERVAFESNFKTDVAALMTGVSADEVEIVEIRSASVVVTFIINAVNAAVAATAVSDFTAEVASSPRTIAGVTIAVRFFID